VCLSLSSLRVRLLVLVCLALVPAFALLIYTAFEQRRVSAVEVQETALRLARLASSDHGRLILETRQVLISLSHLPAVQQHQGPRCSAFFAQLLREHPLYANLGAVDNTGRLFCSAVPSAAIDLSDRAYFRRAVERRGFAIGNHQIGRATKRATINVAHPVLGEGGELRAVVFAAIDLVSLNRFVTEAHLPEGSTLTVVDQAGVILVRHPDGERWIGRQLPSSSRFTVRRAGVAGATEADRVARRIGFAPLFGNRAEGDVYVSIGIPTDVALASANRSLLRNLATLGGIGALTLLTGWVGANVFVLRKVDRLVDATRRLAAGDTSVRAGNGRGDGELDQLATAFDAMVTALESRQREAGRAREELRASNDALRAVFEASPPAIVLLDAEGSVRMWNLGAERLFGWREEEVLGRRNPVIPASSASESRSFLAEALTGEPLVDAETQRHTNRGELIDVSVSSAPVHDSAGTVVGAVVVYVDIRERKRAAEETLRQREALARSEKLAALGRLAAGVAHELKNPLTVIAGRVDLMRRHVPAEGALARHFQPVIEAAQRMRSITEGLSSYSKPTRPVRGVLNVGTLLTDTRELVAYQAKTSGVTIVVEATQSLRPIRADRSQMTQVLVNLATNAIEAMADNGGGELALRARLDTDRMLIEVADTGPGIPEDRLETIWGAFYTTKADGTGLGLSIVRGIIEEQPGATISLESRIGRGTTFTVAIPAAGDPGSELR
jgi:PAS domain S-box-containing protein